MCTSIGLPVAYAWGDSEMTVSRESVISGQSSAPPTQTPSSRLGGVVRHLPGPNEPRPTMP